MFSVFYSAIFILNKRFYAMDAPSVIFIPYPWKITSIAANLRWYRIGVCSLQSASDHSIDKWSTTRVSARSCGACCLCPEQWSTDFILKHKYFIHYCGTFYKIVHFSVVIYICYVAPIGSQVQLLFNQFSSTMTVEKITCSKIKMVNCYNLKRCFKEGLKTVKIIKNCSKLLLFFF